MRLYEITQPDPEHADLARQARDVYEHLYRGVLDALRRFPPPGGEVVPRRMAVVFDYDALVGRTRGRPEPLKTVADVLERLGWTTDPDLYRKGLAKRTEVHVVPDTPRARRTGAVPGRKVHRERRMRIGRILELAKRDPATLRAAGLTVADVEAAEQAFENDPARRGTAHERRGRDLVVVVSFDPVEAAHMSAQRGWQSCWRLGGGEEAHFREALQCGIATAWVTTRDDVTGTNWLDNPTARWLVVPYVASGGGPVVTLRVATNRYHVYGTLPPDADEAVKEAVRRVSQSVTRVSGMQIGVPAVTPELVGADHLALGADDRGPVASVFRLLTTAPYYWSNEVDRDVLRRMDRSELVGVLEKLAAVPKAEISDPSRTLLAALRREATPRDLLTRNVLLALAALGLADRRHVMPPTEYGDDLCDVLRFVGDRPGEVAEIIDRLWDGEDRTAARLLAHILGCLPGIADEDLPDVETAIRILERSPDANLRWGRILHALRDPASAFDIWNLNEVRWVRRILRRSLDPRKVSVRLAAADPNLALARDREGGLHEKVRRVAELAAAIAGTGPEGREGPAAGLARFVRRYGREGLLETLRAIVREAGDLAHSRSAFSHIGVAADLLAVLDPEARRGGRGPRPDAIRILVDAGLLDPVEAVRIASPE